MEQILLYRWWLLVILIVVICVWLLFEIVIQLLFHRHLESLGYISTRRFNVLGIRSWISELWNAQGLGVTWLLRRRHWGILIITAVILALTVGRAIKAQDALEIARAGALVVIAGLLSLIIEYLEAKNTRKLWDTVDKSLPGSIKQKHLDNIINSQIDSAKSVALRVSIGVSIIGTLVWAYGDQMLACELFPLLGIEDRSGANCFK